MGLLALALIEMSFTEIVAAATAAVALIKLAADTAETAQRIHKTAADKRQETPHA